jgi:hypothetical protein
MAAQLPHRRRTLAWLLILRRPVPWDQKTRARSGSLSLFLFWSAPWLHEGYEARISVAAPAFAAGRECRADP